MKFDLKRYIPGFLLIFSITFISMVISKQAFIKKWGISYVLFALAIGLIISNVFKVPKVMKAAGQTEFFVKIGLVCMGATIMFSVVLKAGLFGVAQAVLVATVVWFGTYWICRKFQISQRFSSIIASANAICGVSATIAAGGAVLGDPQGSQLYGGLGAGVRRCADSDHAAAGRLDGFADAMGRRLAGRGDRQYRGGDCRRRSHPG